MTEIIQSRTSHSAESDTERVSTQTTRAELFDHLLGSFNEKSFPLKRESLLERLIPFYEAKPDLYIILSRHDNDGFRLCVSLHEKLNDVTAQTEHGTYLNKDGEILFCRESFAELYQEKSEDEHTSSINRLEMVELYWTEEEESVRWFFEKLWKFADYAVQESD